MRCLKMFAPVLVSLMLLSTGGCGSSGSTSSTSPFSDSTTSGGSSGTTSTPITQGSVFPYQLLLTSNKSTVGIDSEVLFSATLTTALSSTPPLQPIQNQTILFSVVAGPAAFIDTSVTTDSSGTAVSRLKTDLSTTSSSNVIVKASTIKDGVTVNQYATIQVVRQNSYVINFLTASGTSDPSGNLVTLSHTFVAPTVAIDPVTGIVTRVPITGNATFKQLVPFQLLDNNGVPKPNVDVSIEVFNYGRNPDTVIELVPPYPGTPVVFPPDTTKVTIRTDDHGMGILTCNVSMAIPGIGGTNTESIIYRASTTILPENISLKSYGGFIATVDQI